MPIGRLTAALMEAREIILEIRKTIRNTPTTIKKMRQSMIKINAADVRTPFPPLK